MVEGKFDKKMKGFRSDNGGEYMSHEFQSYLSENGTEDNSRILKADHLIHKPIWMQKKQYFQPKSSRTSKKESNKNPKT